MGPGSFDPGNVLEDGVIVFEFRASMGPGSFDPGNDSSSCLSINELPASMGPGSFDPGNQLSLELVNLAQLLQWGRGLSTPEIGTPFIQTQHSYGFNGAGVFRPRKKWFVQNNDQPPQASMGPGSFDPGNCGAAIVFFAGNSRLQWGRGLSTPEKRRRRNHANRKPGFNGAGVFRPRKTQWAVTSTSTPPRLQWGRGLSTPETLTRLLTPR